MSIINSLILTENYEFVQSYISKLEVINLKTLLFKFTRKQKIFMITYKYFREIMSNIKQNIAVLKFDNIYK